MSSRRAWGRAGRSASRRTLLILAALLPALLLGQALGGTAAWLHSHGASGEHLHLLAKQVDREHRGTLHDWHAAQHRHEHEHENDEDRADEDGEPAPAGLLIDLPQILAAPRGDPSLASTPSVGLPALLSMPRWQLALVEGKRWHELHCSGWPPQRARRSGVVALLRSSHAILI